MKFLPKKSSHFFLSNVVWQNNSAPGKVSEDIEAISPAEANEAVVKITQGDLDDLETGVLTDEIKTALANAKQSVTDYKKLFESETEPETEEAIKEAISVVCDEDAKLKKALCGYLGINYDVLFVTEAGDDNDKFDKAEFAGESSDDTNIEVIYSVESTDGTTEIDKINERLESSKLQEKARELVGQFGRVTEKFDALIATAETAETVEVLKTLKANQTSFLTGYKEVGELAKRYAVAIPEDMRTEANFSEEKMSVYIGALNAASGAMKTFLADLADDELLKTADTSFSPDESINAGVRNYQNYLSVYRSRKNRATNSLEKMLRYVPNLRTEIQNGSSVTALYQSAVSEAINEWAQKNVKKGESSEYPPILKQFFKGIGDGSAIRLQLETLVKEPTVTEDDDFVGILSARGIDINKKIADFFIEKETVVAKLTAADGKYRLLDPVNNEEDAKEVFARLLEAKDAGASVEMRDTYENYILNTADISFQDWLELQVSSGKVDKWTTTAMGINKIINGFLGGFGKLLAVFGIGKDVFSMGSVNGFSEDEEKIKNKAEGVSGNGEIEELTPTQIEAQWKNNPKEVKELKELDNKYGKILHKNLLSLTKNEKGEIVGSTNSIADIKALKRRLDIGNIKTFLDWACKKDENKIITEDLLVSLEEVLNDDRVSIISPAGTDVSAGTEVSEEKGFQIKIDKGAGSVTLPEDSLKEFKIDFIKSLLESAKPHLEQVENSSESETTFENLVEDFKPFKVPFFELELWGIEGDSGVIEAKYKQKINSGAIEIEKNNWGPGWVHTNDWYSSGDYKVKCSNGEWYDFDSYQELAGLLEQHEAVVAEKS